MERITAVVLLAACLCGCSSSVAVKVDSAVPAPLVDKYPTGIGVYYEDALRNHVYAEDSEDRENWRIETGSAQVAMFDQVIRGMFEVVRPVDSLPVSGTVVDAVIVPHIDEVQFATPRESLQNFYEAWIRYKIDLRRPSGDAIASWEMTAYGRSSEGFFTSNDQGLNAAIAALLRDAGAKFTIGFPRAPGVKEWLDQHVAK
jgi:hypothetical protein